MRTSTLLLALPVLTSAQQVPFLDQVKGWFGQASASISAAIPDPATLSIPNPVASGAKKIASLNVKRLTVDNARKVLQPGAATASPGIEEWMIFATGGNKTCFGMCGRAEQAWNESVALVSASRSPPHLAMLDCETDAVLCYGWNINPPQVLHVFLPQPLADQSTPSTTTRFIPLNRTSVTAPEIAAIHLQETYKQTTPYEGFFHPFDGPLAKAGLDIPLGWVLWGFQKIPSWAFMVGVSIISRSLMSRRMNPQAARGGAPPAAGQQPAPST